MDFVKTYFNAEKAESLFFIIVGTIAILISFYCWMSVKKSFYTGLAFPLLFIGIIQVAVGSIVYLRSPKDNERVLNYMMLEPERIQTEEIPRMSAVMQSFVYYRYLELGLILTGIMLMFFTPVPALAKGIGVGLFMQASLMLTGDYFAEQRGKEYLKSLREKAPVKPEQS